MASLYTRGSPAPSVSSDGSSYSPPSQVRRKPVPLNPIPSPRLNSLSIEDISTSIPPPGARPPSLSSLEGSFISPRNSNRYAWSHTPRIANARPPLFFSFGSNKEKDPPSPPVNSKKTLSKLPGYSVTWPLHAATLPQTPTSLLTYVALPQILPRPQLVGTSPHRHVCPCLCFIPEVRG